MMFGCAMGDDFDPETAEIEVEEVAELTLPPNVPPQILRNCAGKYGIL